MSGSENASRGLSMVLNAKPPEFQISALVLVLGFLVP